MKYAVECLVRFDTKAERDALFDEIKKVANVEVKKFEHDDSFVQKHLCYHDEDPAKICVVEEKVKAKAAPKS